MTAVRVALCEQVAYLLAKALMVLGLYARSSGVKPARDPIAGGLGDRLVVIGFELCGDLTLV